MQLIEFCKQLDKINLLVGNLDYIKKTCEEAIIEIEQYTRKQAEELESAGDGGEWQEYMSPAWYKLKRTIEYLENIDIQKNIRKDTILFKDGR